MAKYLITANYNAQGIKGVLAEGGTARRAAVEKALASVGGTLESFYFAFGSDDVFVTVDVPGNAEAAALALTVAASGTVSLRTTVLLSPEEIDAATKVSPSYRAPGA